MRLRVALLSLLATWLFFHEYLAPFKWVHMWADFEGYHHPLFTYAHKALKEGRLPEWDASIYSGMPFAGNIQAGMFYPPNWLVFFLNRNRTGVRMKTMEWLEILHIWLAFFLAWLWLRGHSKRELPAVFGAGVFAFTGYPMAEMQHYGVILGYAWYPLGMLGLDRFARSGDWRKVWMLPVASALCMLTGYPANWIAFCGCMLAYGIAVAGVRGAGAAIGGVAFSGLLGAIQLGPAIEATAMKMPDLAYFPLVEKDPRFYLQYLLPNFADNGVNILAAAPPEEQYSYLGSPAFAAMLWLLARRAWRPAVPGLVVLAMAMLFLTNPFELVSAAIYKTPILREVCRGWNFLALLSVCGAFFTMAGLNDYLNRPAAEPKRWVRFATLGLLLGWAVRQIVFHQHEAWLATGWWTVAEVVICVVVFAVGIVVARHSRLAAAALVMTVLAEYYTYGAARRFNAKPGVQDTLFIKDARTGGKEMIGVDNAVYNEMLRHPTFRTAILWGAPHPTDMRHYGLTTPQGFDPFLSRQYKTAIEKFIPFETNRIFRVPEDPKFWEHFGIRFLITRNETELQARLAKDPRVRLMEPANSFYNIFEFRGAKPAYQFDSGSVECLRWKPEDRVFRVQSAGGAFILKEQFFPGWKAYVDGVEAKESLALDTFQSVQVPAGEHRVEFRYRSPALRIGAAISLAALVALVVIARSSRA